MDKIKPLFTASATAVGGRNGHSESSDGIHAAGASPRTTRNRKFQLTW
jgi:organic hydroperoxide reductase OsmC/OhrA